jgi:hypothetical protein
MPQVVWPLWNERPCIEIELTVAQSGQPFPRTLIADTGGGLLTDPYQLVLVANDCLLCGGVRFLPVTLGGAFSGSFPLFFLPVRIPALAFDQYLRAVGVPSVPPGFDGIACFNLLNRFTYGNLGDPSRFGLAI